MLQIGVHHRDDRGGAGHDSLDDRAGQTAPTDALQAQHPIIGGRDRFDGGGGPVGGAVVDKDDPPGDAGQRAAQAFNEGRNVAALIEGRDDHRQIRDGFQIGNRLLRLQDRVSLCTTIS